MWLEREEKHIHFVDVIIYTIVLIMDYQIVISVRLQNGTNSGALFTGHPLKI